MRRPPPSTQWPPASGCGRRRPGSALAALARTALLLLAVLATLVVAPARSATLLFEQALAAPGDGPRFPAEAQAVAVPLPDESHGRAHRTAAMWYRVTFDAAPLAAPGSLLALQIRHVCATLAVQLNGELVHSGGRLEEPYTQDCGFPQLITLPPALLRPSDNRLDLMVVGPRLEQVGSRHRAAALSTLVVGPRQELKAMQVWQSLVQVSLPQSLDATLLLMGSLMLVLGFFDRAQSHLVYFGVLSAGWALLDAPLWLREWPLPQATVEVLLCALQPIVGWAAVQFLLRYARWRHPAVDRGLALQAALVPLTLLAASPDRLYPTATAWSVLLTLQVAAAAVFYLHRLRRDPSLSFWLMGSVLAAVAAAGAVGWYAQTSSVPPPGTLPVRLVIPLMLVLVGLRLVQQHGRAFQQAEAGKALLEQRVREATAEVERNFQQLAELRIEQVTERERKRIAADLHDDLGAKLLTIVHTSESDRISTLAREALEEMRLSVRGLTGRAVRLADALGDWRAEVVSRLAQAGIETDWSAPEDLPQTLSARAYVQTTRILREATSNIIKHSGSSYCSVRCQVADGDFQLVVQDNGEGIVSEPGGRLDRGHGMATMKQRAKQLQGQCLVESGPGFGTVIRLTLPLDRALAGT